MEMEAFFRLHADLPREGPGTAEDVAWACSLAGVARDGAVLDAGSGPGGDVTALLSAVPEGSVLAVDSHDGFAAAAQTRFAGDRRVRVLAGDMMAQDGPFDLIWSAGAIYFVGVTGGLTGWREVLAPGGAVVFSSPCLFREAPAQAVIDLFEGYPVPDAQALADEIAAAGYELLGTRRVSDAGWEAYYQPMETRIAELRTGADAALAAVLDDAEREIETWRAHRADFGYLICVVRPV